VIDGEVVTPYPDTAVADRPVLPPVVEGGVVEGQVVEGEIVDDGPDARPRAS
jgi:hypothetical protein